MTTTEVERRSPHGSCRLTAFPVMVLGTRIPGQSTSATRAESAARCAFVLQRLPERDHSQTMLIGEVTARVG